MEQKKKKNSLNQTHTVGNAYERDMTVRERNIFPFEKRRHYFVGSFCRLPSDSSNETDPFLQCREKATTNFFKNHFGNRDAKITL